MADDSHGYVASNLLCTENENLCFGDLESLASDVQTHQQNDKQLVSCYDGPKSLIPLPFLSEEDLTLMLDKERGNLPKDDYLSRLRSGELDLNVRREALDWIWKVHDHYNFGALSICLSMNYLDRFLSFYNLPKGKSWAVQLLAVTCLSLAAKVEEIKVPLTVDLQVGEPKFVFEGKTIQRMELLVLNALMWRMQACTPCSFIDHFLRKINNDETPPGHLISRAIQTILSTIRGIDFLEFKPSEIAAAVALSVSNEIQAVDIDEAISSFIHVQKEKLTKCLELIQDLTFTGAGASSARPSVPQSPIGVLDAACLSYKSDETTVGSSLSNASNTTEAKRRKIEKLSQGNLEKS